MSINIINIAIYKIVARIILLFNIVCLYFIFFMYLPYHNVYIGNIINNIDAKTPAYDKANMKAYGYTIFNKSGTVNTSVVINILSFIEFLFMFSKSKKKS